MLNQDTLKNLSKWTGLTGIVLIISGILSTLWGMFFMLIGAIPGIVTIILGLKARQAKARIDYILTLDEDNPQEVNAMLETLSSYFMLRGIITLVLLILGALAVIIGIVFFIFLAQNWTPVLY